MFACFRASSFESTLMLPATFLAQTSRPVSFNIDDAGNTMRRNLVYDNHVLCDGVLTNDCEPWFAFQLFAFMY